MNESSSIPGVQNSSPFVQVPPQVNYSSAPSGAITQYAGFWRRVVAAIIDSVILQAITALVGVIAVFGLGKNFPVALFVPLIALIAILYFALFESSSRRATPGKMIAGIQVTDLSGNRISFVRALGRYFAKILSALILCIGFLMAAFTQRKQALHDMVAGTVVITYKESHVGKLILYLLLFIVVMGGISNFLIKRFVMPLIESKITQLVSISSDSVTIDEPKGDEDYSGLPNTTTNSMKDDVSSNNAIAVTPKSEGPFKYFWVKSETAKGLEGTVSINGEEVHRFDQDGWFNSTNVPDGLIKAGNNEIVLDVTSIAPEAKPYNYKWGKDALVFIALSGLNKKGIPADDDQLFLVKWNPSKGDSTGHVTYSFNMQVDSSVQ